MIPPPNRLGSSTSPYLLQHAHNPVDWYPWGDEAIAAAKAQDKPIFLSIGYSTCYWCHVMEREVFESAEIAALMNTAFINIKVDREQRPDLDEIYMTATQLMTGHGGWPNSLFLTPDLRPFFAGTYFGAVDVDGRPGFPTLVANISQAWTTRRTELEAAALRAANAIARVVHDQPDLAIGGAAGDASNDATTAIIDDAIAQLASRYDNKHGGFGGAPKFPQDFFYEFLLDSHAKASATESRTMAVTTLAKMAQGGIHDHVGGGFHRYSVDAEWKVPHFEKMLYNQAQLSRAYVAGFAASGDASFAHTARDTIGWVLRCMTSCEGGFYSALDAETDAVEGAYFVWNRTELERVLGEERLATFDRLFTLEPVPIFRGHKHPDGGVSCMRAPAGNARGQIDAVLAVLLAERDQRALPRLDDKVIASWNGMMIGALAMAGRVLGDESFTAAAERAGRFVLENIRTPDGGLWRTWRRGIADQRAFFEDYAFVMGGLLELFQTTRDESWLAEASALARIADERFLDAESGGYFATEPSADLIARAKQAQDGAIPSGNSAMLHNLVGLWRATHEDVWRDRIESLLHAFGSAVSSAPAGHIHLVHGLARWLEAKERESVVAVDVAWSRASLATDGTIPITIDFSIAAGWHIDASVVTISIRGHDSRAIDSVKMPAPVLKGRVRIAATARVAGPAELVVRFHPCNATECLAPVDRVFGLQS